MIFIENFGFSNQIHRVVGPRYESTPLARCHTSPHKGQYIKYKKELLLAAPFYEFPIGTISKVKKIVLGS